jgi:hypothetical protein
MDPPSRTILILPTQTIEIIIVLSFDINDDLISVIPTQMIEIRILLSFYLNDDLIFQIYIYILHYRCFDLYLHESDA